MDKLYNFLKEIWKSFLVFMLYIGISIYLSLFFSKLTNSTNFFISNLSAIAVELIIMLTLLFIYRKKIFADIKEYKKDFKNIMNIAFKNWVIGLLIMFVSNIIISMIAGGIASNEEANRNLLLSMPIYAVTAMIFIAPITEELVFRLSPRKAFTKKYSYVIYSALLFGGMHLISSTSLIDLLYIIPYGALGFFFAKTLYETDNVISSISIHMIHNTIAVILAYITLLG